MDKGTQERARFAISILSDILPAGEPHDNPQRAMYPVNRNAVARRLEQSAGQAVAVFVLPSQGRSDPDVLYGRFSTTYRTAASASVD